MSKKKTNKSLQLDCTRLREVSIPHHLENKPDKAYVDQGRGWCVQLYDDAIGCKRTPWEGTLRVGVTHTSADNRKDFDKREYGVPITWDELQAIKDYFWRNQIAIEVYPPKSNIVNVANMRWLWVLPPGASLPFNLGFPSNVMLS